MSFLDDMAKGVHTIEDLTAWVENAATVKEAVKLGVSVYKALRSAGVDPIFASKEMSDAAISGAELAGDLAEDAKFGPAIPPPKAS